MKTKELQEMFEKIPEDKKGQAKILLDEIKFMLKTTKVLKAKINKNGPTELFEQGSQKFERESPALKSYNQTMKILDTYYKTFSALVPETPEVPTGDDFDEFVNKY